MRESTIAEEGLAKLHFDFWLRLLTIRKRYVTAADAADDDKDTQQKYDVRGLWYTVISTCESRLQFLIYTNCVNC